MTSEFVVRQLFLLPRFSFIGIYKLFIILPKQVLILVDMKDEEYCDQKIIGNEELDLITGEKLKTLYHSLLGALRFLHKDKQGYVGSGTLISPNLILTAAHNVYDRKNKHKNMDHKFYLGVDGVAQRYHEIESFRFPEEYQNENGIKKHDTDYALLKLKNPIEFSKYLPLTQPCELCLLEKNDQTSLFIHGYPKYKGNYGYITNTKFKLHQYGLAKAGRITYAKASQGRIKYKLSTLGGDSGTSVCVNQEIIAVHYAGSNAAEQNIGRLVTRDMINNLNQWTKELNAIPFSLISRTCKHKNDVNINTGNQQLKQLKKGEENNQALKDKINQQKTQIIQCEKTILQLKSKLQQQVQGNVQLRNQLFQEKTQNKKLNELHQEEKKRNAFFTNELSFYKQKYSEMKIFTPQELNEIIEHTKTKEILQINCQGLKAIDLAKYKQLKVLSLKQNQLEFIDLRSNAFLTELLLNKNKIQSINLSRNSNLKKINLSENKLKQIIFGQNQNLGEASLWSNQISSVDLTRVPNIFAIDFWSNRLKKIDLTSNPKLMHIQLRDNLLEAVAVWYKPELTLNLTNQRSATGKCELTLLYRRGQAQQCKKWGQQAIKGYNSKLNESNKYKCLFSCKSVEIA